MPFNSCQESVREIEALNSLPEHRGKYFLESVLLRDKEEAERQKMMAKTQMHDIAVLDPAGIKGRSI